MPERGARKVLVCGSNYGRTYVEALRRTTRYELAGLLAQGSEQSRQVAFLNRVPLLASMDELPERIDLACVALPSEAQHVSLKLIRRGVPILCEHPLRPDFVESACRAAQASGTVFHVNAHFGDLPAGAAFSRAARRLLRDSAPVLVELTATERSFYAALDIIGRSVGVPEPAWQARRRGDWILLEGEVGAAPLAARLQWPRTDLPDGSPEYVADIRVALYFSSEILTLLSVAGPVVSNRNLGYGFRDCAISWRAIDRGPYQDLHQFREDRLRANLRALRALERQALGGRSLPWQEPAHLLGVSRSWEAATAAAYSQEA